MKRREFLIGGAASLGSSVVRSPSASGNDPGCFVPAEEDVHAATLMQWPVSRQVHPDREFLGILQQTIADIANSILAFEPVILMVAREDEAAARRLVSQAAEFWDIATEDLWCRDSGPLFCKTSDGQLAISHLQFNGWGRKQIHQRDGKIALQVAERLGIALIDSGLKGEAGAVEHDGHGLLIAHESSWINDNRNPGMSKHEVGARLCEAYGAERIIWSRGVRGEDITDYHIDSLARFTGPGRVLINLPEEPDMNDPFHLAALHTHDVLLAEGLAVDVIPEPTIRRVNSLDFVASYANFYVCNDAVISAQFGDDETDNLAITTLQKHYPNRQIVSLDVDALGEVGGGIHCATQQLPAL